LTKLTTFSFSVCLSLYHPVRELSVWHPLEGHDSLAGSPKNSRNGSSGNTRGEKGSRFNILLVETFFPLEILEIASYLTLAVRASKKNIARRFDPSPSSLIILSQVRGTCERSTTQLPPSCLIEACLEPSSSSAYLALRGVFFLKETRVREVRRPQLDTIRAIAGDGS
jgi:hypothetical protein